MTRGPNPLTQATAQGLDGPTEIRTGTVTAVTARGITVAVAEGTVPAAHLDSYAPAVGDPVAMAAFRDSWLALGRPVGTGTATDLVTPGSGAGPTVLGGMVLSGTNATMASSTGSFVTVPRYRCTYHHPANHQVMIWGGYARVFKINEADRLSELGSCHAAAPVCARLLEENVRWSLWSITRPPRR